MAETAKSKAQAEAHLQEIEDELERLKSEAQNRTDDKAKLRAHLEEVLGNIAESHNFYDSQRMAAEALEWLKKA
jgi:peptidoglycan hydrolase CwlO-like protein